jgi:hypothetical protein
VALGVDSSSTAGLGVDTASATVPGVGASNKAALGVDTTNVEGSGVGAGTAEKLDPQAVTSRMMIGMVIALMTNCHRNERTGLVSYEDERKNTSAWMNCQDDRRFAVYLERWTTR